VSRGDKIGLLPANRADRGLSLDERGTIKHAQPVGVADRVDVGTAGAHVLVDLDERACLYIQRI